MRAHGPSGSDIKPIDLKGPGFEHYPEGNVKTAWSAPGKHAVPDAQERKVLSPSAPHADSYMRELKKLHENLPGAKAATYWSIDKQGKEARDGTRHDTGLRLDNQGGVSQHQTANIQVQKNGHSGTKGPSTVAGLNSHEGHNANHYDFANALSASMREGRHVHLTHPDWRPAGRRRAVQEGDAEGLEVVGAQRHDDFSDSEAEQSDDGLEDDAKDARYE